MLFSNTPRHRKVICTPYSIDLACLTGTCPTSRGLCILSMILRFGSLGGLGLISGTRDGSRMPNDRGRPPSVWTIEQCNKCSLGKWSRVSTAGYRVVYRSRCSQTSKIPLKALQCRISSTKIMSHRLRLDLHSRCMIIATSRSCERLPRDEAGRECH